MWWQQLCVHPTALESYQDLSYLWVWYAKRNTNVAWNITFIYLFVIQYSAALFWRVSQFTPHTLPPPPPQFSLLKCLLVEEQLEKLKLDRFHPISRCNQQLFVRVPKKSWKSQVVWNLTQLCMNIFLRYY